MLKPASAGFFYLFKSRTTGGFWNVFLSFAKLLIT